MVHVKKCPLYGKEGRGKPTTEFYKIVDGKEIPQIYCMGWIDLHYDEPLDCCKNCKDWVYGEQLQIDFEEWQKVRKNERYIGIVGGGDNPLHHSGSGWVLNIRDVR